MHPSISPRFPPPALAFFPLQCYTYPNPARFGALPMPLAGLVDTTTGLAADPEVLFVGPGHLAATTAAAGLTDLGEGTTFEIAATTGQYLATITGNAEISFAAPQSGAASTSTVVKALCVSTGCLSATFREEDVEGGITEQAATYSGSFVADTSLRTATFLLGGINISATFAATLSDSSATDDPIAYTMVDTDWYLVEVPYRAGAAAQTLDWSLTQTSESGSLLFMSVDVTEPGATGAASLTITSTVASVRRLLSADGIADFAHYGRETADSVDAMDGGVISSFLALGSVGNSADGGAEVAFAGIAPASEYAVTIAGETGYSGVPGAGYLRLDAVVLSDSTQSISESSWGTV